MRSMIAGALIALPTLAFAAGPISKFDTKPPVGEYDTAQKLEDIERCLIDMDGWLAPNIYRQPDRPDDVTLVWISGGMPAGTAAARIDLKRTSSGTHVTSWMPAKQAAACTGAPGN